MKFNGWVHEFPAAVTVCDAAGVILEMNAQAARAYAKQGGAALVGTNLLDCHPEPSRSKLVEMLASGKTNVYTIEKGGVKKLVYQSPWFEEGSFGGFVEIVIELPNAMPHFVRGDT